MFTRILVPTDFSEPSEAALDYARALAGTFGASLHLLHVFNAPCAAGAVSPEGFIAESPEVHASLFEDARSRLQRRVTATDRNQYGAKTEIVTGSSPESIVNYAKERGMDLIVMGTHGRSGLAHLLIGSVAEKVVRTAPCPVMTVRRAPATRMQVPDQVQQAGCSPGTRRLLRQAELLDPVAHLVAVDPEQLAACVWLPPARSSACTSSCRSTSSRFTPSAGSLNCVAATDARRAS